MRVQLCRSRSAVIIGNEQKWAEDERSKEVNQENEGGKRANFLNLKHIRMLPMQHHLRNLTIFWDHNWFWWHPKTRSCIESFTSLKDLTSLPQSHASQPASRAPHMSFLRSSPTCTASSGCTPKNSQAFRNIVGFGFSASTCFQPDIKFSKHNKSGCDMKGMKP